MLTLAFTFPAGRYHATPWERHVNEGAVVWPPEPWRVLRGLIATWHHKVKHTGNHEDDTLGELIEALSKDLPLYKLPAASHSHTRHYMPQWKAGNTSLVFDAFAAVNRDEPLLMSWQDVELSRTQQKLLDDLLDAMGYLGRAESWVEAKRLGDDAHGAFQANCIPGNDAVDKETGELLGEVVLLFAPLPASEYIMLRKHHLPDKKAAKKLGATLPEKLLDALSVETSTLRKLGWSQPPAARKVNYLRPVDALKAQRKTQKATAARATTTTYMLIGKPLPRVEDSLRIGELMRVAVMSQAKKNFGEDKIPSILSGHDMPEGNRHRHAFYLPWDSNGDGRIDRVVLHVPDGMDAQQQQVVAKIKKLWSRDGSEWRLVLESMGGLEAGGALMKRSATWESVTPYLHPWHVKKRLTVKDQILRECRERGLPEPVVLEPLDEVDVGRGRRRRPIHFQRFRNRRGVAQPDRLGSFWRLTFSEPVQAPMALGFACHFGLGLFAPCYWSNANE